MGDTDLKPENIKEGVEIFGKTGTYTGEYKVYSLDDNNCAVRLPNGRKVTKITSTGTVPTFKLGS